MAGIPLTYYATWLCCTQAFTFFLTVFPNCIAQYSGCPYMVQENAIYCKQRLNVVKITPCVHKTDVLLANCGDWTVHTRGKVIVLTLCLPSEDYSRFRIWWLYLTFPWTYLSIVGICREGPLHFSCSNMGDIRYFFQESGLPLHLQWQSHRPHHLPGYRSVFWSWVPYRKTL